MMRLVDVVTTKLGVTVGGFYFENAFTSSGWRYRMSATRVYKAT
jgi:hypothetical protein